jgi:hypothetical protein
MMEILNPSLSLHDKQCIGCKKHGKEVMLTIMHKEGREGDRSEFIDVFLTHEQARDLSKKLLGVILQNEEEIG